MKHEKSQRWWERLINILQLNTSWLVIVVAAAMLEVTMGVLYYSAQNIIQQTMERVVEREMNTIYLGILNKLTKIETITENLEWVVRDNLSNPKWMYSTCESFMEHNPSIKGCCIMFVPHYYKEKGYWFDPFAYRTKDDSVKVSQLGSVEHDYTRTDAFKVPLEKNCAHWCQPYKDANGAKVMMTTYCVPVHDKAGKIVAIAGSDVTLEWLDELIDDSKSYQSTQRFLITRSGFLLAGKDNELFREALDLLEKDNDEEGYKTVEQEHGEKLHVFYHPVGGMTDWILISVCNNSEVIGKIRMVRKSLGVLVLAGLLLLVFIVIRTRKHLRRLNIVNAEKERIAGELMVASKIQQSMLPHQQLNSDTISIHGSLVPAREVGGDLFDYHIRDGKLFFCIGDVSGKGAPSAMLMAVIHTMFRTYTARETNPAYIMKHINIGSCHNNESNMFATFFLGVLDLPTGHLRYCNAGHDVPFIIDGGFTPLPAEPNLPVGVFDDTIYKLQETQIKPGTTIFLYTDGLTEAMNSEHQQFGIKRVEAQLGRCLQSTFTPQQILEAMTQEVHHFVGEAEQSDDLTMLAIRYEPKDFENN